MTQINADEKQEYPICSGYFHLRASTVSRKFVSRIDAHFTQ